jgi:F-type H+-transporting ATPase subunit alpha
MHSQHADLMRKIEDTKDLDADADKALRAAVEDFKKTASY